MIGSEQPQVQATCDGVPIKRFGFCWVLGEAPDLLDDVTFQLGNANPRVKVHPKDSSQIKRNYLGVTTTRMPRSTENDYLPLEAIHLIDGNLQTCWMSRSQTRPDVQPIWIRLDLTGNVSWTGSFSASVRRPTNRGARWAGYRFGMLPRLAEACGDDQHQDQQG